MALTLSVLLLLRVLLGVGAAVPVPELLLVGEHVALEVAGGVPLELQEVLSEFEAEAPAVRDAVGEALTVLLRLTVVLPVLLGVSEPD